MVLPQSVTQGGWGALAFSRPVAGLDFSDHRHSIREQQGAGLSPTLLPAGELDQRPHRSCVGDGDSHLIPELRLRQSPAHRRPEGLRDAGGGHTDVTRGASDSAGPCPCGREGARLRGRAGTCESRDEPPLPGWPLAMSLSVAGAASLPPRQPPCPRRRARTRQSPRESGLTSASFTRFIRGVRCATRGSQTFISSDARVGRKAWTRFVSNQPAHPPSPNCWLIDKGELTTLRRALRC